MKKDKIENNEQSEKAKSIKKKFIFKKEKN